MATSESTYPQPAVTNVEWPKISLVTPSYNQAEFLEFTIQSVLAQRYPNLEYVIIDGGSTDGSVEIIRRYSNSLHYWCSEPDGGMYHGINKGFAQCSGDIMAWLNSDDLHFPWALKTVASVMSELRDVDWVTTLQPGIIDIDGFFSIPATIPGICREAFLDGKFLPPTIGSFGWMQQESTFWRRSLWDKVGRAVPTNLSLAGDFALWTKFLKHSSPVGLKYPIAGFRFHPLQKTENIQEYTAEALSALTALRKDVKWTAPLTKILVQSLFLHQLPIVRRLIRQRFGYSCEIAERVNQRGVSSKWQLRTIQFI